MKLSKETIKILEHFAEINSEFLFREGSKISTCTKNKSLYVEAEIKETFPMRVGVSDLKKILSCAKTLGNDSDLNFLENSIKISNKASEAIFGVVEEDQITSLKNMPNFKLSGLRFEITSKVIKEIKRYAWLMRQNVKSYGSGKNIRLGNLYLIGDGKKIYLEVFHGSLGSGSEKLTLALNEPSKRKFIYCLNIELLMMIDDDYVCEISEPSSSGSNVLAIFTGKTNSITYYISLEICKLTPDVESVEVTPDELIAEC